ncbi:hypothetical protein VPH35_122572 [Triticum aestivum]
MALIRSFTVPRDPQVAGIEEAAPHRRLSAHLRPSNLAPRRPPTSTARASCSQVPPVAVDAGHRRSPRACSHVIQPDPLILVLGLCGDLHFTGTRRQGSAGGNAM